MPMARLINPESVAKLLYELATIIAKTVRMNEIGFFFMAVIFL